MGEGPEEDLRTPAQITARGNGPVAAGGSASHNATGKGATVNDNRTYVTVAPAGTAQASDLPPQEEQAHLDAYAEQLRALYGRLDLEVLIPTTEGEHPRMDLRDVFVPPLLRADPPRLELPVELQRRLVESGQLGADEDDLPLQPGLDRQQWEQARRMYRERPAVALLETLASADATRAVLLGDPGAGKSTVARYLALTLTSDRLAGPLEPLAGLLPVMVELRRYAEAGWRDRSFEEFLAHLYEHEGHAPSPALLRQRLGSGRALVVFDGLDELFDRQVRETVARRITGFAARYPGVRIVVTSRVIGYRRHLLDTAGFGHYMIQSLDDEQIAVFARQWYAAACPANDGEAKRLHLRLIEAVERSRPVRELAGNPLLLTILAIIARRQRLPRDRAGVYQHAVNVLIAHWDEDTKHLDLTDGIRAIADLDDRDRREMLERLARHMQSGEGGIAGNHVLAEDVEKVFTDYLRETLQLQPAPATTVARAMVNQFRERNFILSRYGSEVYGFVHRAFLEYLAASDIVRRYEQRELSDEDLLHGVFRHKAPDADWHEVLLLIVAQTGEHFAAQAVDTILSLEGTTPQARPAVLALRALSEVRRIGRLTEQSNRTARALGRYLQEHPRLPGEIEQDLETSFSLLGHSWAGARHLLRWLHASDPRLSAFACFHLFADEGALRAVALAAPNAGSRSRALYLLAERWREDRAERAFVMERAVEDPSADVRAETLDVIGAVWPGDPAVQGFLRERAEHDPHRTVRMWALEALVGGQDPDARTWGFLRALLTDETLDEDLRDTAAMFFANSRVSASGDDWRALLEDRCIKDPSGIVRSQILESLGSHLENTPADRQFVIERIASDPDESVRVTALQTLAQWSEDPDVRTTILAYATQGAESSLRECALQTFATTYWDAGPDDRARIRDWAINHAQADARCAVLVGVASSWDGEASDARDLLLSSVVSDPDPTLRQEIVVRLCRIRHWSVLEMLQERVVDDPDTQVRVTALIAMSECWADVAAVRILLVALARNDPNSEVRSAAQENLDRLWPPASAPSSLAIALRQRALEDTSEECFDYLRTQLCQSPHSHVRATAAQLLGSCWPADARTLAALTVQEGSEEDPRTRALIKEAAVTATVYAPVRGQLF
ncbi:HEAT repeat domain-containing protein [Streptomyces chartreusis]|uniref:HEAT repeat domain-containing protein n=1 Tax=Streptomyces chartreusis TaxID=1969 RepID=UPI00379764B7